ncbi:hypothetical protein [Roseibium sp. M-1]
MQEFSIFSQYSKFLFFLGGLFYVLFFHFLGLFFISGSVFLLAVILVSIGVLTSVVGVALYVRELSFENSSADIRLRMKDEAKSYFSTFRPYLFFVSAPIVSHFLFLIFYNINFEIEAYFGELPYIFVIYGIKIYWIYLILIPIYFLSGKINLIFEKYGDLKR